jgi:serine/threonine protein kinase
MNTGRAASAGQEQEQVRGRRGGAAAGDAMPLVGLPDAGLPLEHAVQVHDRGGSRVFRARSSGREVAVKVGERWRTNAWVALAPAREAQVLRALGRWAIDGTHPAGTWHLQQWHEGHRLFELLTPDTSPGTARETVRRAAAALARLHRAGWVHGDLQPDHVILTPPGVPDVLIDLALAHPLPGTPAPSVDFPYPGQSVLYEPPEISAAVLGGRLPVPDAHSDVWSLAASCVMALTGRTVIDMPWPQENDIARLPQRTAIAANDRRRARLPGDVGAVLEAALSPVPAHRPTAAEMAAWLSPSPADPP